MRETYKYVFSCLLNLKKATSRNDRHKIDKGGLISKITTMFRFTILVAALAASSTAAFGPSLGK
jgi:hypothetical protein